MFARRSRRAHGSKCTFSLAAFAALRATGIPHRAGGHRPFGRPASPGDIPGRRRTSVVQAVDRHAADRGQSGQRQCRTRLGNITGTTAALSVLGSDAQGESSLVYRLDGHQRARGRHRQIQRQRHQRGQERYGHLHRGRRLRHNGDDHRRRRTLGHQQRESHRRTNADRHQSLQRIDTKSSSMPTRH